MRRRDKGFVSEMMSRLFQEYKISQRPSFRGVNELWKNKTMYMKEKPWAVEAAYCRSSRQVWIFTSTPPTRWFIGRCLTQWTVSLTLTHQMFHYIINLSKQKHHSSASPPPRDLYMTHGSVRFFSVSCRICKTACDTKTSSQSFCVWFPLIHATLLCYLGYITDINLRYLSWVMSKQATESHV